MTTELPRLVVVDDDKQYLELVAVMSHRLPNLGAGKSAFFSDISQAINFFDRQETKDNPPKLIILNYRMADLTVIDVLQKLKNERSPYKEAVVIITSASITQEEKDLCYDFGANQVFDKTFDEDRLNSLLKLTFAK